MHLLQDVVVRPGEERALPELLVALADEGVVEQDAGDDAPVASTASGTSMTSGLS